MKQLCRHCGAWEVDPDRHNFCGGCGAAVGAPVSVTHNAQKIQISLDLPRQANRDRAVALKGARLLARAASNSTYRRIQAEADPRSGLVVDASAVTERGQRSTYIRIELSIPGEGEVAQTRKAGWPTGVVASPDAAQNTIIWDKSTTVLTAMSGLDVVPVYLHPSAPVIVGSASLEWEQGNGEIRKVALQPLYADHTSEIGIVAGPDRPFAVRVSCADLTAALSQGRQLKYEVRGRDGRGLGGGLLVAKLSTSGKAHFSIRKNVMAWGAGDVPARVPFQLSNSGGSPIQLSGFSLQALAGTPAPDLLGKSAWPDEVSSGTVALEPGVAITAELRFVPGVMTTNTKYDQPPEVHRFKAKFKWRPSDQLQSPEQQEEREFSITVNRRSNRIFDRDQAKICIDFGTTQSSAVLVHGEITNPTVRILDLDFAGIPGIVESRPFLDTVIAIEQSGRLSFGQDARALARRLGPERVRLIEDSKWKLTSTDWVQVGHSSLTYADLVRAYLAEIKRRIEGHPEVGSELKDVLITCPAQFEDGQKEALIEAFTAAGFNAQWVQFPSGPSLISESWPPVLWALSGESSHTAELLPDSNAHLVDWLKSPQLSLERPAGVLPRGPLTPEQESPPHSVWALTFDMGGGSTDLSALRMTLRPHPHGAEDPVLEVADVARSTSVSRAGEAGFVGREFERLAREVMAARLGQLVEPAGSTAHDPRMLIGSLSQPASRLSWQVDDYATQTTARLKRVETNLATITQFADTMRMATGPLDASFLTDIVPIYRTVLDGSNLTGDALMERAVQLFMDQFERNENLRSRVSRVIKPAQVWRDDRTAPEEVIPTVDWWLATLALFAGLMLRFQSTLDKALQRALPGPLRNEHTMFVLSGRAGLLTVAKAYAIAKFQAACGISSNALLRYVALDEDRAKLVTALGGAYMGRIFDEGNATPAQFIVCRASQLGIRKSGFVPLEQPTEAADAAAAGALGGLSAAGLPNPFILWARDRSGSETRVAKVRLTQASGPLAKGWIIIRQDGEQESISAWHIPIATLDEAVQQLGSEHATELSLEMITSN